MERHWGNKNNPFPEESVCFFPNYSLIFGLSLFSFSLGFSLSPPPPPTPALPLPVYYAYFRPQTTEIPSFFPLLGQPFKLLKRSQPSQALRSGLLLLSPCLSILVQMLFCLLLSLFCAYLTSSYCLFFLISNYT